MMFRRKRKQEKLPDNKSGRRWPHTAKATTPSDIGGNNSSSWDDEYTDENLFGTRSDPASTTTTTTITSGTSSMKRKTKSPSGKSQMTKLKDRELLSILRRLYLDQDQDEEQSDETNQKRRAGRSRSRSIARKKSDNKSNFSSSKKTNGGRSEKRNKMKQKKERSNAGDVREERDCREQPRVQWKARGDEDSFEYLNEDSREDATNSRANFPTNIRIDTQQNAFNIEYPAARYPHHPHLHHLHRQQDFDPVRNGNFYAYGYGYPPHRTNTVGMTHVPPHAPRFRPYPPQYPGAHFLNHPMMNASAFGPLYVHGPGMGQPRPPPMTMNMNMANISHMPSPTQPPPPPLIPSQYQHNYAYLNSNTTTARPPQYRERDMQPHQRRPPTPFSPPSNKHPTRPLIPRTLPGKEHQQRQQQEHISGHSAANTKASRRSLASALVKKQLKSLTKRKYELDKAKKKQALELQREQEKKGQTQDGISTSNGEAESLLGRKKISGNQNEDAQQKTNTAPAPSFVEKKPNNNFRPMQRRGWILEYFCCF